MADELDHLRNLGAELVDPDEDGEQRARELLQQRIDAARAAGRAGRPRRPRLRWSLLIASAMLLAGSALGFGLGSWLTPSGSAGGNFVGFGFLPAHGWNVMQAGTLDEAGEARAIAANVALEPSDDFERAPLATVKLLPADTVLIHVTFSPRGDPARDGAYPVREPPLRLDDAEQLRPSYHVARYRLRAGIGGYNVDARVFFGENAPSTRAVFAAQSQLNRLVVANDRVTIRVQPSVVGNSPPTISGSVDSNRAGETVTIQAKDCGLDFFRVADGTTTREGGGYSTIFFGMAVNTTVRAVWRDATSAEITVRKRARVLLQKESARRFTVAVFGKLVWRKRVVVQRFDRRLGTWSAVKSVVLTDSVPVQQGMGGFSIAEATFTASLPRGTLIRAVFPLSQARPCTVAGTSNSLRT